MWALLYSMRFWIKYVGTTQKYKMSDKMMWAQPNNVSCQIKLFQDHSAAWQILTVWTFCQLQVICFCTFCMFSFLLCRQPVSVQLHISGCNKLHHLGILGMWRPKSFGIFIVITFLLKQCNWYFNISNVLPTKYLNRGTRNHCRNGPQILWNPINAQWFTKPSCYCWQFLGSEGVMPYYFSTKWCYVVKLCITFIVYFLTGNNSTKMYLIKYREL